MSCVVLRILCCSTFAFYVLTVLFYIIVFCVLCCSTFNCVVVCFVLIYVLIVLFYV